MVSIIVPVYNAGKKLCYCIDSILKQSYQDFELILINDGSTDNSGRICDKYSQKDDRVFVVHTDSFGVSKARNTGIELAKGEYVCFVDSDDYIDKNFLDEVVKIVHKGYKFVLTAYQCVDNYEFNGFKNVLYENKDFSIVQKNNLMDLSNLVLLSQPWNKIFKREILVNNNIRMPEDLSLGEDTVFVYRYLSCIIDESFCVINKPMYFYYSNNSNSLVNKYRENLFDVNICLNKYLYNEVKKWGLCEEQLNIFYNSCYYRMETVLYNTFRKENTLSNKDKLKYNNKVIQSDDFKYWLKRFKGRLNIIFKCSYILKSYYPIYLLQIMKGEIIDK